MSYLCEFASWNQVLPISQPIYNYKSHIVFFVSHWFYLQTMFCKSFGMFWEAGTWHFLNFLKRKGKTNALTFCNILKIFQEISTSGTYRSVETSANLTEKHSTHVIPNLHTEANEQIQISTLSKKARLMFCSSHIFVFWFLVFWSL